MRIHARKRVPRGSEAAGAVTGAPDLLSTAHVAHVATDLHGVITCWNDAATEQFGWSAAEAVGRAIDIIVPDDRRDEVMQALVSVRLGRAVAPAESVRRTRDGRELRVHVQAAALTDGAGAVTGMSMLSFERATTRDADRAHASAEARYRALADALAEFVMVVNEFGRVAAVQAQWSSFTGQTMAEYNGLGWREALHPVDRALLDVQWDMRTRRRAAFSFGARVLHATSGGYRYCRFRAAPVRDAQGRLAEWVLAVTDAHDEHIAEELEIAGQAGARPVGGDPDDLGVDGPIAAMLRRESLRSALERTIAEDALQLAFQPVVALATGRPVAVEALLRSEIGGRPVPTAQVVHAAEETGMMRPLTDWVLQAACAQFGAWRRECPEAADWKLHINVSACDLVEADFVARVRRGVRRGGLTLADVCLELTETAMMTDVDAVRTRLDVLRRDGLTVAIDDFGTGYASLGMLRDVPADVLKIDRMFVASLHRSDRDRAIVEHTIGLAHRLGITVVAEGVENLAQIAILEELGCDQAQGFAFAYPVPVGELRPG